MKMLTVIVMLLGLTMSCRPSERKIQKKFKGRREMAKSKLNELTAEEKRIIIDKGTEQPFTGKYNDHAAKGVYACTQCNAMLYRSADKFKSSCGWPSFDDEIRGAIERKTDADGSRTEILCATCGGHLGHVFKDEGLTEKNVRHCVNSVSLDFVSGDEVKWGRAIFAGGCFWGVEYFLQQQSGVIETSVGYIGGSVENPDYEAVCGKATGHAEAVEVLYDPVRVSFETLAKVFFETHDPTQEGRQGPDVGEQYRSEIFYVDDEQRTVAKRLIDQLRRKGLTVVTRVTRATSFWKGEKYHQDYYQKKGGSPYCHGYVKRF